MKISIAIPTYECNGRGPEFLDDLLRTIEIQTFKDFEVVISDHSLNNNLVEVIKEFEDRINIVYLKNPNNRGNSPANTNNAISHCTGDIIKVMFQDDFFYDDESLEKIHRAFEEKISWLVCGSNHTKNDGHTFYWDFYPTWNDNIIRGVNTISSPSVLAAKREVFNKIKFDENLVMMMDCEFYFHAKKIFGDPLYYNDVLITNRVHEDQISTQYNSINNSYTEIEKEIKYCIYKHYDTI